MPLDDLIQVIDLLKERTKKHRAILEGDETRTRMALVDPILRALGWDVSDPAMVIPEYRVVRKKADYALLDYKGRPVLVLEAKTLGNSFSTDEHLQMLNYANMDGVPFAGLTDGNQWKLYDVFDKKPLSQRCIMDLNITSQTSHRLAIQFLLLWRTNIAPGSPIGATEVINENQPESPYTSPSLTSEYPVKQSMDSQEESLIEFSDPSPDWTRLTEFVPQSKMPCPPMVRLHDRNEVDVPRLEWKQVFVVVAEYLVRSDILTAEKCLITPLTTFGIHTERYHKSAKRTLSNGLHWRCYGGAPAVVRAVKRLMCELGQDPSKVWLKTG